MKLSSKTHYGLMACHILAKNYDKGTVNALSLGKSVNVSSKYLEQIMRMLSKRGIISANRGTTGGYYLSRPPELITIGEIARALEDDFELVECVSKDCVCHCPSSLVWKKLYKGINEVLDGITLGDMLNGTI